MTSPDQQSERRGFGPGFPGSHAAGLGTSVLGSVLRHPLLVVGVVLAFALAGFLWSSQRSEQYTATTRIFLSSSASFDGTGQASFVNDPDRYAVNQASLALSTPVLEQAITDGGLDTDLETLREAVEITAGRGTDVLLVEATAPAATDSARWANAVADAYRSFKAAQVSEQTQELLRLSTSAEDRSTVLRRAAAYGDGVTLVEEAEVPESPASPQPVRDTLIAAVAGLVLGIALAFAVDVGEAWRRVHAVDPQIPDGLEGDEPAPDREDAAPDREGGPRPVLIR